MPTPAPDGPLAGLIADARQIPAPFQPQDQPLNGAQPQGEGRHRAEDEEIKQGQAPPA